MNEVLLPKVLVHDEPRGQNYPPVSVCIALLPHIKIDNSQ